MMRQSLIEQLESRLLMAGVVSGDFTGDGVVDIVTTQGGLKLRVGNGNGTFRTGVPINGVGFARGGSVAAADFNDDGALDLAVFGGRSATAALNRANGVRVVNGGLFVLLNNGNGIFRRAFSVSSGTINSTRIFGGAVTTGDFNDDGNQDILVTTNATTSTTPTPIGTGGSTGFFVGTSFGGVGFVATDSNAFFAANSGFTGLTGAMGDGSLGTGTTGLLGGMGGFLGTNGTFGPGATGTTTPTGAIGQPEAVGAVRQVAFVINGNGNGTFQAPRRIVLL